MKIWCLLSWYDERGDWLANMVHTVAPLVDGVIAVDGPYPLTPHDGEISPVLQHVALQDACRDHRLELHAYTGGVLPEVEKRALLFKLALSYAEPMRDWFLIMDGDMYAGEVLPTSARAALYHTPHHAAEVTFHNLDPIIDSQPKVRPFRSLFRAIPGLTVEGTHSNYTVPDHNGERLLMWQPIKDIPAVPALDLTSEIHLYHRPHLRDPQRQALRATYYNRRSSAIESVPDY